MRPNLRQICDAIDGELMRGVDTLRPTGITHDSRKVSDGSIFVAIKGFATDGHRFIPETIARGAVCVISESAPSDESDCAWIKVRDIRTAMAQAADMINGHPSKSLALIGITGTNGKTTTAFLVNGILESIGRKSAILSTVEYRIAGESQEAARTTPEATDTNEFLRKAVDAGCDFAVMEASSQALDLNRCDALSFKVAVFTNLTRDHLDYHGDMENYFDSKVRLFDGRLGTFPEIAVINIDDEWGRRLVERIDASKTRIVTFGINATEADVKASHIDVSMIAGTSFELKDRDGIWKVRSELIGIPHTYNILAAYTACRETGIDSSQLIDGIPLCKGAPGRFDRVKGSADFAVFVDYAHTDDALENTLRTAQEICDGRVITVFGCGGDRDKTKRAPMGRIAGELSDHVIVTSDNPRNEDPNSIIEEIAQGLRATSTSHQLIVDRRDAIVAALNFAKAGDIVLICGKGHEPYQIIGDSVLPFDDRAIAKEILQSL